MRHVMKALVATLGLLASACGINDIEETETEQGLHVASWVIWRSPEIPVCWDSGGTAEERRWVREALRDSWEAVSSVRFINWNNCQWFNRGLRIRMINSRAYTTGLGMELDGVALGVNLDIWDRDLCAPGFTREDCVKATAVHEFGHALGFAHEQTRADTPDSCTDGNEVDRNGNVAIGAWDPDSVMNYCNVVWNGRGILSWTDVVGVRQFYGTNGRWTDPRLFDANLYLARYSDLRAAFGTDTNAATIHWLSAGLPREGRRASRTFDVGFYLNHHADLRAAFGTDRRKAIAHFWEAGLAEGRRASREFDVRFYETIYPDVAAAAGGDHGASLDHWIYEGLPLEGRRGSREVDVRFYEAAYGDIAAAFGSNYQAALDHWIVQGLPNEARRGSREFDVSYYRSLYGDIAAAFGTSYERAFDHFAGQGLPAEGRRGSREVDVQYYATYHPDLQAAFGTNRLAAIDHFIMRGLPYEGRRASADFDVWFYLASYSDLRAAFGTNYQAAFDHWVARGALEGRIGVWRPVSILLGW